MKFYLFIIMFIFSLFSCQDKKTSLEGLWVGGIKNTKYGDSITRRVSLEFKDDKVTSKVQYIYDDIVIETRKFKIEENNLFINNASSDLSVTCRKKTENFVIILKTQDSLILSKKYSKSGVFLKRIE